MMDLLKFAESLVSPIRVCVVDSEEETSYQVEDALTVYNCKVHLGFDEERGCNCLQAGSACSTDLLFISDTTPNIFEVLKFVEKSSPNCSIVILTRKPKSDIISRIMGSGVYTFLVKNGSFTEQHVRTLFQQLNLRLCRTGNPVSEATKQ